MNTENLSSAEIAAISNMKNSEIALITQIPEQYYQNTRKAPSFIPPK